MNSIYHKVEKRRNRPEIKRHTRLTIFQLNKQPDLADLINQDIIITTLYRKILQRKSQI